MSDPQTTGRSTPLAGSRETVGRGMRLPLGTIVIGLALLMALLACVRFGFLLGSREGVEDVVPQLPDKSSSITEAVSTQVLTADSSSHEDTGMESESEVTESASDETPVDRLRRVLAGAEPRDQRTAAVIAAFTSSGSLADLRSLDRVDVEVLAAYLADQLSPEDMGALFQQFLGLPVGSVRSAEEAESALVGVYDALVGNHVREVRPSVLTVTDAADADGRVTGQAHVLPAGTGRVYAVFENDRALAGLNQVLAVWRDPNDDKMVFTEFEPIRRGAAYNYVWLEVESGWPAGRYQVELFHPEAQSLLLASEGFSVR